MMDREPHACVIGAPKSTTGRSTE